MIRLAAFFIPTVLTVLPALAAEKPQANPADPADAQEFTVEDLAAKVRRSSVVVTHADREGGPGGTGSGFVISDDGLIATCAHVIGESRPLTVRFDDGTEHEVVEIHAWDAKLDLSILRIAADGLDPLPLAEPASLAQGTEVVAMGAPHGLEFSVVRGVVSALREIDERDLIQIAIPIEPGNSGGPLLDRAGRVHGLLTMKSAVTDNLGFAVPVDALHRLLDKPNPVAMEKWLTIGKLDPKRWVPKMGADWKQRAGRIVVSRPGDGFGGRSLCLSAREVPEVPYEVAVDVLLDDESGAAGLVFASDGADRHYGFYPSGGNLRLTRFDGPNVYTWEILDQVSSDAYRPGEWNRLRVRVEEKLITGFVNGEEVVALEDTGLRGGQAGLAKFRQTEATFRRFQLGRDLAVVAPSEKLVARLARQVDKLKRDAHHPKAITGLAKSPNLAQSLLREEAGRLRSLAENLEAHASVIHRQAIAEEISVSLADDAGLMRAALLIAKLDNPEVEVEVYLEELERMAGELAENLPDEASLAEKVDAIRTYLFQNNGFHGSRSDYYNRSNSYMNEVIDDREGIPITLSLLFMELGRRVDVEIEGLGLPGHFVAFFEDEGERRIIDPFERGRDMPHEEADALLRQAGFPVTASEMPAASPREIVSRMLRNLKAIAIEERDFPGALGYVEALVAVSPDDHQERLSRALLHLQTDHPELAKPDLEWILEKRPEGIHLDRIEELYRQL